jgi:hypothetical protein
VASGAPRRIGGVVLRFGGVGAGTGAFIRRFRRFRRVAGGRAPFALAGDRGIVASGTCQLIGRAVLRFALVGGRTGVLTGLFDGVAGGRRPFGLAGVVALGIGRLIGRAALLSGVVGTGTGVLVGSG